jgi:hypothetical protein
MIVAMILVCNALHLPVNVADLDQGIVGQVIIVPEVGYGGGKHVGAMSDYDYMMASKLNYITQPFYAMAISFVKVSIGFFLLRVAVVPFYRRTLIAIMVFVGIYTVVSLVVSLCILPVMSKSLKFFQRVSSVNARTWPPDGTNL